MFDVLRDFFNKAFANQAADENHRPPAQSQASEPEGYQYPEFTKEDHEDAKREGFFDAYNREDWIEGGKRADDLRTKIRHGTKAQTIVDLESEGISHDDIARLSDEALHLTNPYYKSE